MTGEELKEFATSLLDGDEMEDTPFYIMINIVKTIVEAKRPWRQLLSTDSTLTASPSDSYSTLKTLPTGFIMFDKYTPMILEANDGSGEIKEYKSSRKEDLMKNKNGSNLFYTDLRAGKFGLIGTLNKTYTIHANFIKESEEVDADTEWEFPSRFHPLLAYMVSGMQKGGVDYDDIFARMAPENKAVAVALMDSMEMWDDNLQNQENNY